MNTRVYSQYTSTATDITKDNIASKVHTRKKLLEQTILSRVELDPNWYILDIGCGWGGTLKAFENLGYSHLYGCDTSSEQVKHAHSLGLETVECMDAMQYLDQTELHYDVICLFDVLEHLQVEYAIELLTKIHAKLREGGKLIIRTPNGNCPFQTYYFSDITHVRAYTPQSFNQILSLGGFNTISCYDCKLPALNTKLAVANWVYSYICKYCIAIMAFIMLHSTVDKIYTANIIAIATKTH